MAAAKLTELHRYPAVAGPCLIATGIFAFATPEMVAPLQLDLRAFWEQPWRLLTSALVHAGQLQSDDAIDGLLHLGFNVYLLWRFGTQVERRLGHLRTLVLLGLFAVGGSLLEYGFSGPSVGLSGVLFGVAGLLAVLAHPTRGDPAWRGAIDGRSINLLAIWFLLCIALTAFDIAPIANFAHAGGAILGALAGWTLARGRTIREQLRGWAALAATVGLFVSFATVLRPTVNFSKRAGLDAMVLAEDAAHVHDLDEAIAWAERGVGYHRTPADHWAFLARLYFEAGRIPEAIAALERAIDRDPDDERYAEALVQLRRIEASTTHAPHGVPTGGPERAAILGSEP